MSELLVTLNPPNGRGCGDRKEEKPYIAVGAPAWGMPVETKVPDPLIESPWGWKRGMELFRKKSDPEDLFHLAIYISKNDYPSWWSFIREVSHYGLSRRTSENFPIEKLDPGRSEIWIIHARGIPTYSYSLAPETPGRPDIRRLHYCKWRPPGPRPKGRSKTVAQLADELKYTNVNDHWIEQDIQRGYHPEPTTPNRSCAFSGRSLAYLDHMTVAPETVTDLREPGMSRIEMPSFGFAIRQPLMPTISEDPPSEYGPNNYLPAVVLILKFSHVEFKKKANPNFTERAESAGIPVVVLNC